ncbi:hypothetical protein B0H14DRAFT_3493267 [Mycena olivaceomarginata]|nr:hypothetical protein B0H14DRAFT_3493267 [Mycena olivaceomarginata]
MSRKPTAKKPTVRHFAPRLVGPIPSVPGSSNHAAAASTPRTATTRVMLEKTQIRHHDGHVSQSRSVVDVAAVAGNKRGGTLMWIERTMKRTPRVLLGIRYVPSSADWKTIARHTWRRCFVWKGAGITVIRLVDCVPQGAPLTTGAGSARVEGSSCVALASIGPAQRHWHHVNRACPVPTPAIADDFGGHPTQQLLRAQLWPATTTNPKTAATFVVLCSYHLMSFESKCSSLEFYKTLARQTDNLGAGRRKRSSPAAKNEDTQREGKMEKACAACSDSGETDQGFQDRYPRRAGRGHDPEDIANTKPGECALLCPACPHPGKNLLENWKDAPPQFRFLYALFLALDANFRLKRKDISSEAKDPGLGDGWAFFCEVVAYMEHVQKHWDYKQDRSHCVAHDTVDKPDREARGTASSGICTLGERYINMDYMFLQSIAGSELVRFFVSYDIVCQWHINLWSRMAEYKNEAITIDGRGKFMMFLIPKFHLPAHIELCNLKFSFHLTPDVGQTDGEAPERRWADANPLARSTKEMGPGARRDALDDHFNDWNHKKIVGLGRTLRRKTENAVPEMVQTREALQDLNESLESVAVQAWTEMAEAWEADETKPNPFETQRKDAHVAKVRAELAEEAAAREMSGMEDEAAIRGDMHITELLAMGIQLEDQQRILASDVSSTGLHPTDGQRRAMVERTSKLRRKIFTWVELQTSFFPGLQNVRQQEDEERACLAEGQAVPGISVSDLKLWLPSAIAAMEARAVRDISVPKAVHEHEYRLRVGQANESLHEARRLLLVRTHLYKLKDTTSRGVRANMRSQDKISALNDQIRRAADQYRTARVALVTLGGVLQRNEWERTLKELREDDVRGLPQSQFHDPDRKKKKKRKTKKQRREAKTNRVLRRGSGWPRAKRTTLLTLFASNGQRPRARCHRWREEVDLLEEEMARGQREGDEAQLEGEAAYALRQAAIQTQLARGAGNLDSEGAVRNGDADDEDKDEDGDGEEESEDEEELPISSLPQRPTKPTLLLVCLRTGDDRDVRRGGLGMDGWRGFQQLKARIYIRPAYTHLRTRLLAAAALVPGPLARHLLPVRHHPLSHTSRYCDDRDRASTCALLTPICAPDSSPPPLLSPAPSPTACSLSTTTPSRTPPATATTGTSAEAGWGWMDGVAAENAHLHAPCLHPSAHPTPRRRRSCPRPLAHRLLPVRHHPLSHTSRYCNSDRSRSLSLPRPHTSLLLRSSLPPSRSTPLAPCLPFGLLVPVAPSDMHP